MISYMTCWYDPVIIISTDSNLTIVAINMIPLILFSYLIYYILYVMVISYVMLYYVMVIGYGGVDVMELIYMLLLV